MQTSWQTCGEKLDRRLLWQAIREALQGVTRSIAIGRSSNRSGMGSGTPIEVVSGDDPPTLQGKPYLSTTFRRGSFSKTLYTPSTLRVVVGVGWLKSKGVVTQ